MKISIKIATVVLVLMMITSICAYALSSTEHESERHIAVKGRASRIFSYAKEHQNVLPGQVVFKLSVALEFHDDAGAEKIVNDLEQTLE